ncbi:WAT1-related protein At1g68170-like isoform X2 [Trifolium pratense]|uniref:WAT1-related protein At1g68170-like isoform X2 n=1 Tax=Trifolium pratense TaxID=57577 RepID=UPI001E6950DE|nr:WAT1-related protein At1g68170-like isoform X2 [Trifolium pratense]
MVKLLSVETIENAKPIVLMIVVQSIYAVVNIMLKMVTNDGSSLSVLIAYRFVFSTAFTVPLALFFERMEKPNLGTPAGKAKLIGTLSGIGGAMILTLYKGKRLFNFSMHIDLLQQYVTSTPHKSPSGSHVWGIMLALGTSLSFSLWYITQSKMAVNFPWHYSTAALTSLMGAIQSFVFALCTERDRRQWKIDWNLRLLTAASGGILASGVCFVLLAWCVRMKGPLYVSAFNPLLLVLVAFIASLVLDEYITVGSLTGATLIVCGLYMLLWGKSKEARQVDNNNNNNNMNEMVSVKDTDKCDSIHIANSSLTCIQKDHDKNTLGEV